MKVIKNLHRAICSERGRMAVNNVDIEDRR